MAGLASGSRNLAELEARQSVCRACPRLVSWREEVAVTRRKSYRDERYWGRPIAGWGDKNPSILIVGLAPAAHGGNRTGRIFTGDRSGDFLFASLYRCGLAAQPTSVRAGDGQRLIGTRMAATVRCAPPDNKPTPAERDVCAPWLVTELRLVSESLRAIVCLGGFAWQALFPVLARVGYPIPRPRPAFGHAAEVTLPRPALPPNTTATGATATASTATASTAIATGSDARAAGATATDGEILLLGCYHPSQQNTFTGRVTPAMLDAVFTRARSHASRPVLQTP